MAALTPETIERVLHRLGIDIAERHQRYFIARCRSGNHPDRNPSWFVSIVGERAGQHVCRSCKWGGSLIDLVMHVRDEGFPSAKAWLEEIVGGEGDFLPTDEIRVVVASPYKKEFVLPPEVTFQKPFPASVAKYLASRQIEEWQIDRHRIGYATFGWLAGRIIFVTWDLNGKAVNYTGRTFVGDPKRYRNASEEQNPDFSVFFGEEFWPDVGRRIAIVNEGAADALAVERSVRRLGKSATIAALNGSNVTPVHLLKLSTFERVIGFTDNDVAGNKASYALESGLVRMTDYVRVTLPLKMDANKMLPAELDKCLLPLL